MLNAVAPVAPGAPGAPGAPVGFGTDHRPVYSTLLSLVQSLQDEVRSEEEVVEAAIELVNGGRVVLTGNFKGCRLEH